MQINKKAYTTFIITVLTISMVLMALPLASAAITAPTFAPAATGPVGSFITIGGTCTAGAQIEVYWDSQKAWDGTAGLIASGYATGTAYSILIVIPEATAGDHEVIVKDLGDSSVNNAPFTVTGKIALTPSVGLAGDVIAVTGTGFNPDEYITMTYWNGIADVALTTSPLMPKSNTKGSFTCTFVVPADAANAADNIDAADVTGETASATLTIGPYITLNPQRGLENSVVQVSGRGFTPGKVVDIRWYLTVASYVTVLDNAPIDTAGGFTVTITVPLLPDPVAPGTAYTIRAIDNNAAPVSADATFTLIKNAGITLTPAAGKVASSVTVDGTWFSASKTVTVTFDGTQVATATTDGAGTFSVSFAVPEAALGAHTITATDSKGVSASATFTVVVDVFMVETRATEYVRMDFLSITSQATAPADVYLVITDPNGLAYIRETVASGAWVRVGAFWYIPYDATDITWWPLTADAPLGTWNFTAYTSVAMTTILDTNLFTVVDRATMQTVLDRLDEIEDVIITTEGDIIAVINTKTGTITTKLDPLMPKLQGIEDTAVIIATMLGEVQVDIAALDLAALDALGVDITAIKGDVATIKTNIGTVTTNVATLDAKVTSISGDVATVSTTLGTLEGTVTAIDGKVATISTNVGTIKADVSDIKAKPDVDMTPVWIAVVLSLIAAIAAIFAVVTIRQKIAG